MRKYALFCLLGILLAALLTGCVVQSFYPFYTDKSKVDMPQLAGEWDLIKSSGDDVSNKNIRPWVLSTNEILATSENNATGQIQTVYFKVGTQVYCDSMAGDPGEVNEYWYFHHRPVHTVSQVDIKDDVVTFRLLDYEWFKKALDSKEVSLPFLTPAEKDSVPLITASPEQWQAFLKKHGNTKDAFPDSKVFVLKKRKAQGKD